MDELKLSVKSKLLRMAISAMIKKQINKKFNGEIDFAINDLDIRTVDGKLVMHLDANASMDQNKAIRLLNEL